MSRILTHVLEVFILAVVFAISATISSFACSVTNRQIINTHIEECVTVTVFGTTIPNAIYKKEVNRITFSDGDFDNVEVAGWGFCGSPSITGSSVKCYPEFHTPTTGACIPAASNCVRWKQLIRKRWPTVAFSHVVATFIVPKSSS